MRDDAVRDGQAESGAAFLGLGGEERLEDAAPGRFVHADAGIGHRDADVGPRSQAAPIRHPGIDEGLALRDRQRAAVRHRVGRIDGEVDEDLLHLTRIRHHGGEARGQRHADLDVLAQEAPEHGAKARDHAAHIERARLQHLLPAEREELLRERCGTLAGLQDVTGVHAQRIGRVQPRHHQLP